MRKDKDYEGALDYMMSMCQKGYGFKKGNVGWLDRDTGLGFTIDYFNVDPESLKPTTPKTTTVTTKSKSKKGKEAV